jgi:hypothetical protein
VQNGRFLPLSGNIRKVVLTDRRRGIHILPEDPDKIKARWPETEQISIAIID